ncbi:MAG: NADH-quinone oxidoreductase subunit C [Chloroflexota bacterium]|nr:NADH-quinone oxidoreductase subunit C [Chloroflexota bacterium]
MTIALNTHDVAEEITKRIPDAVEEVSNNYILVKGQSLYSVSQFLKDSPSLYFDYLNCIVGTDYIDYIEVVYILESYKHNSTITLKARAYGRDNPTLPSVVALWAGADFQEREIFDLLGVTFTGHPKMKRIFLWEDFEGYPLRRDFL